MSWLWFIKKTDGNDNKGCICYNETIVCYSNKILTFNAGISAFDWTQFRFVYSVYIPFFSKRVFSVKHG